MRVDIPTRSLGHVIEGKTGRERTEVKGKAGEAYIKDGDERAKGVGMKSGFHFSFSEISISIPL